MKSRNFDIAFCKGFACKQAKKPAPPALRQGKVKFEKN
jgi:hypothetical protein